jgi:hypothetical protein
MLSKCGEVKILKMISKKPKFHSQGIKGRLTSGNASYCAVQKLSDCLPLFKNVLGVTC